MINPIPKRAIAAVSLLLLPLTHYSQVTGGLGSSSPNPRAVQSATAAGLNSIYSPNIYDGSTTVNIPIHSYTQGGREYGVSLSYHTKGVRIDEIAGPAGLHWNVMAEGTITRVVKDLPDELNAETAATIDFDDTSFVNKNRYLKGKFVTYTETAAQQATPNVYRDGECDEFVFSCGGQSFTFYLGRETSVFTHPHRNIKVSPLIDGVPVFAVEGQPVGNWGTSQFSNLLEFLIRDEEGTQYYFVRGDYEVRRLYTNEYYEEDYMGNYYPTIKWVIRKITFANGNEINYTYYPAVFSGNSKNYKQYYAREQWSGNNPVSASFLFESDVPSQQYSVQLQKIQYPNGTETSFEYGTGGYFLQPLNEIRVTSGNSCIRYQLSKSQVNNRSFLDAITLTNCDGTLSEPYYSFAYNTLALPDRLSSARDFYGYYNGSSNGQALGGSGAGITVPVHHNMGGSLSYLNYGSSRLSNSNNAQAGILKKVNNAYGGQIEFGYESNFCSGVFSGSSVTLPGNSLFSGTNAEDGLRLVSVKETDKYHPGNERLTHYDYQSGQTFMPGGYFHYPEHIDNGGNWDKLIFQNNFLTPQQTINGSNHGYSIVKISTYIDGQLSGRKEMTFSNMKDATSNQQPRYYTTGKHYFEYPYTDKQYLKDWEMGLPLEIKEYDRNQKLVKQTSNYYNFSLPVTLAPATHFSNVKTAKVAKGDAITVGNPFDYHAYYPQKELFTDAYTLYTGRAPLVLSKVRTYVSDTRYVEDSTLYAYDDRDNIKTITTQNSKGERFTTAYVYNYDAGGTGVYGGAAPGSVLYNMTETGLEAVVSTERWKQAAGGGIYDQRLISADITTFSYQGGVLRSKGAYTLMGSSPMSYQAYTGLTQGGPLGNPYTQVINAYQGTPAGMFEKNTEVELSDENGNPLQTSLVNATAYKAMIWDNRYGKLLAEVANAKYQDIAFSGFEAEVKGNLEYDAADITSAAAVPGGGISGDYVLKAVSTAADPLHHNGLSPGRSYTLTFWCYGGIPTVSGAGLGNIPLTISYAQNGWTQYTAQFSPADGSAFGFVQTGSPASPFIYYLDDVRLFPSDAAMQNYNYNPLFGITASTDASGRITYFEYDKLGRKSLVRDQQGNILSKTQHYNGGAQ